MTTSDVATLKIIFGGSKPLRLTLKTNDNSWSCEQLKKCVTDQYFEKKIHKCEEGGAHLKCFFLFGFIDELEKQLFIKKTAEVGQ